MHKHRTSKTNSNICIWEIKHIPFWLWSKYVVHVHMWQVEWQVLSKPTISSSKKWSLHMNETLWSFYSFPITYITVKNSFAFTIWAFGTFIYPFQELYKHIHYTHISSLVKYKKYYLLWKRQLQILLHMVGLEWERETDAKHVAFCLKTLPVPPHSAPLCLRILEKRRNRKVAILRKW